jgi:chromosomal replication initiator protein
LIKILPEHKIKIISDKSFDEFNTSICEIYNQDSSIVYVRGRKREIVQSRQMCMSLAKLRTKKSYSEIGRHYGGFNHATVLHSVKTVKGLLETNRQIRKEIGHLFEGVIWPKFKN